MKSKQTKNGRTAGKVKRSTIVKKLDKVFSQYIRERDKNRCFTCGKEKSPEDIMTCGHLFSRIAYSTRWDELNAHCQCWPCNYRHEFDFELYRRQYVKVHGIKQYDKIYLRFKKPVKFADWELLEILEHYKNKLQTLTEI